MGPFHKIVCFLAALIVTILIFAIFCPRGKGEELTDQRYIYVLVMCENDDELEGIPLELKVGNIDQNLDVLNHFNTAYRTYCSDEIQLIVPLARKYSFGIVHFNLEGLLKLSDEKYNFQHLTDYWKIVEIFQKQGWFFGQANYIGDIKLSHQFLPYKNEFSAKADIKIQRKEPCREILLEEEIITNGFCPRVVLETQRCTE